MGEELHKKIKTIESIRNPPSDHWARIMEELKDVKQSRNASDSKILEITDTINTKLLPCIEQANRKIEGTTNRLDAFGGTEAKINI